MNNKICIITNIGTHYRYPIYKEMSKKFSCDFYLGDHVQTPIKTFDYITLPGYKETLKNKFFHHFYWQKDLSNFLMPITSITS